jgi:hypothetical protein
MITCEHSPKNLEKNLGKCELGSGFGVITETLRGLEVMTDRLDMDRLKQEQMVKRTRWLVWTESLAILGLLVWVSLEYENNLFLQSWAKANIGAISFLLNGTLAGLYAGILLGYAVAKYAERTTGDDKILESVRKRA